ncbi:hypothetical protein K438DRAFT_1766816 [Mycena galopus ATCC 62051]|nr:hypothetical protein K438DRAFT_1766816 [Mycena galopus ATCC 62051]
MRADRLFSLFPFHFESHGAFAEISRKSVPSHATFIKALNAPPTPTDGVGGCYAYFANGVLKFGRSNDPPRRKKEWQRQCSGEPQVWLDFYWEIPYAKKFERVMHLELKRLGAWYGRKFCPFCWRKHQEKFDLRKYGGVGGLVLIVEARLTALGWNWQSTMLQTLDFSHIIVVGHASFETVSMFCPETTTTSYVVSEIGGTVKPPSPSSNRFHPSVFGIVSALTSPGLDLLSYVKL